MQYHHHRALARRLAAHKERWSFPDCLLSLSHFEVSRVIDIFKQLFLGAEHQALSPDRQHYLWRTKLGAAHTLHPSFCDLLDCLNARAEAAHTRDSQKDIETLRDGWKTIYSATSSQDASLKTWAEQLQLAIITTIRSREYTMQDLSKVAKNDLSAH